MMICAVDAFTSQGKHEHDYMSMQLILTAGRIAAPCALTGLAVVP
jgi:hypothetical protein